MIFQIAICSIYFKNLTSSRFELCSLRRNEQVVRGRKGWYHIHCRPDAQKIYNEMGLELGQRAIGLKINDLVKEGRITIKQKLYQADDGSDRLKHLSLIFLLVHI